MGEAASTGSPSGPITTDSCRPFSTESALSGRACDAFECLLSREDQTTIAQFRAFSLLPEASIGPRLGIDSEQFRPAPRTSPPSDGMVEPRARGFRHDLGPEEVFDSLRYPDNRIGVRSAVHCSNPRGWPFAVVHPGNDLVRCRRADPPLHPAFCGRLAPLGGLRATSELTT